MTMITNQEMCYYSCPYNNVVDKFTIKIIVVTKTVMRENALHTNATRGCGAMAFFASSVIGSFSTVCVSALTPNAVDKMTSMVRL